MEIDQGDLLWGMSMIFVQKFMNTTTQTSYGNGDVIFREGEKAVYFYTLVEGCVKLTIGDPEQEVYTITRAGEAFGWSSLLDRNYYSATAVCSEPTVVRQIERSDLNKLLEKNPEYGFIFYKKLSGMLGSRLIQCYRLVYSGYRLKASEFC